ncbi:hypothetical protein [Nonomuraea sp. NPDC049400]|uniref:hypothetical protein n=1 Tax=Nonomuraea sp. NPDC049400 TaxID=3364352 RepID=UPI0037AE2D39
MLLIIREPAAGHRGRDAAAARALRRISETTRLLGAIGCTVRLLSSESVLALLGSCFDPDAPPLRTDLLAAPDLGYSAEFHPEDR